MSEIALTPSEIDYLLSPMAIRDRANAIVALTEKGGGQFVIHEDRFRPTVDFVLDVIKQKYPAGDIPFHSRWGHFRAGGINRPKQLQKLLGALSQLERARTELDLVITSVLLDAGAGSEWKYSEQESKTEYSRSEGLGVASYHMFLSGCMSGDQASIRADEVGLKRVSPVDLERYFQVTDKNPLVGVEGRVKLLNGLGRAMKNREIFKNARPGNIIDYLVGRYGKVIPATGILRAVLDGFGPIWPGRLAAKNENGTVNLGDMWRHSKLGPADSFESLVPIHKLSQWMTYSLIEPILDAGFSVVDVDRLTGLAEYRNGGLLIDMGVLSLRDSGLAKTPQKPDSDIVVEWRALTIHFLDRIGREVQKSLGKTPQEFPLAKVLEGGTWWAGRFVAKQKRPSGDPPLQIASDGTVF